MKSSRPGIDDQRALKKLGAATLTFEADYATGDDDPRTDSDITTFSYARDLNVGLLLFEHVLAFESARSVGVGIHNLSSLAAASFPLTEARTEKFASLAKQSLRKDGELAYGFERYECALLSFLEYYKLYGGGASEEDPQFIDVIVYNICHVNEDDTERPYIVRRMGTQP